MGKQGKKQRHQHQAKASRRGGAFFNTEDDDEHYPLTPPSVSKLNLSDEDNKQSEGDEEEDEDAENQIDENPSTGDVPSKFSLYQQSVQSPKGDISYLQKFFLMYVGGRVPLHFQEDFCGTALLSAEWLRTDSRRTAVGLDFDLEALKWCIGNNINKIGADGSSRLSLFHGNVLNPHEARLVKFENHGDKRATPLGDNNEENGSGIFPLDSTAEGSSSQFSNGNFMKDIPLPGRDIVCAFNYSCCCLHSRAELVSYYKHARNALSRKGGIFVMDLYGGTSSECELRMQRKFSNFTYVWEQAGFDIVQRKTRISLHFHLHKPKKKIQHAFSYSWRLWSLPEIKDCLEEAGFRSVHFWIRQMPDSEEIKSMDGFGSGRDVKFEEVSSFEQQDSWNAYIVGVA